MLGLLTVLALLALCALLALAARGAFPVSGVRYPLSNVKCQVSSVDGQMPGARCKGLDSSRRVSATAFFICFGRFAELAVLALLTRGVFGCLPPSVWRQVSGFRCQAACLGLPWLA